MHLFVSRTAAALIAAIALAGCGNKGDPAPAPQNVTATPGDGRVVMSWSATPGIDYWIFGAADPSISIDNWTSLPGSVAQIRGETPQPICALTNQTTYWLIMNARSGDAAGGPASAVVTATPRVAGDTWNSSTLGAQINGVGFGLSTLCRAVDANSDTNRPATGKFIAVGNGASVFTSIDGQNWTAQTTPSAAGFTSDLYAASAFTGNPGSATNLEQLWIAVGADSAALRSVDAVNWEVSQAPLPGSGALRAIAHNFRQFVAVGDSGRIRWSGDGVSWYDRNSPTTQNLHGVAFDDNRYIALGDAGTLMISGDSTAWSPVAVGTTAALRGAVFGNNNANPGNNKIEKIHTWVVVGDAGTVLTSTDHGGHWSLQTLPGAPNLVGVGYTTQFIALDTSGAVWRSVDGIGWSGPSAGPGAVSVIDGTSQYGIIAVGAGGTVASSF